jgi:hypothetical protein
VFVLVLAAEADDTRSAISFLIVCLVGIAFLLSLLTLWYWRHTSPRRRLIEAAAPIVVPTAQHSAQHSAQHTVQPTRIDLDVIDSTPEVRSKSADPIPAGASTSDTPRVGSPPADTPQVDTPTAVPWRPAPRGRPVTPRRRQDKPLTPAASVPVAPPTVHLDAPVPPSTIGPERRSDAPTETQQVPVSAGTSSVTNATATIELDRPPVGRRRPAVAAQSYGDQEGEDDAGESQGVSLSDDAWESAMRSAFDRLNAGR